MRRAPLLVLAVVVLGACGGAAGASSVTGASPSPSSSPTTTTVPTTTTAAPTTSTTTTAAPPRTARLPAGTAFAAAGDVTLALPSSAVERVGLHQSNHEGAVALTTTDQPPVPTSTLESRERLTTARTAADVVTAPDAPIVAPVTGRVLRAGSYTLYCRYTDEYVVIEPDGHPDREVKLLHLVAEQVGRGQRVVAGETVVAAHAHQLPFASQVDELDTTGTPWPHVHVEVVDPSIRNVPSPGGGC